MLLPWLHRGLADPTCDRRRCRGDPATSCALDTRPAWFRHVSSHADHQHPDRRRGRDLANCSGVQFVGLHGRCRTEPTMMRVDPDQFDFLT